VRAAILASLIPALDTDEEREKGIVKSPLLAWIWQSRSSRQIEQRRRFSTFARLVREDDVEVGEQSKPRFGELPPWHRFLLTAFKEVLQFEVIPAGWCPAD